MPTEIASLGISINNYSTAPNKNVGQHYTKLLKAITSLPHISEEKCFHQ